MRLRNTAALVTGLLTGSLTALPVGAAELPKPTIEEWPVPWQDSRPRDPYVGPQGDVWFVGQRGHYVAVLDPESGEFRRIDLDNGTGPHNLIVGDDGTIYYAGNLAAHIGRIDPATEEIHKIPMPDPAARDPHTLVFDGAGNIFFSVQGGNMLGRLNLESETVDLVKVPTANARPYGIVVAPSGTVWATAFGTNKLLKLHPQTMALSEIVLPRPDARPRRLELTSDGRVWYVDYAKGMLGFLHPDTGLFKEYPTPGGSGSRPYGMAVDAHDRLWFVESGLSPNRFVGFDPVSESFTEPVDVPSGGGTVRHMYYDADTDVVWFGADTKTVGRADLSP
jgi:virginiamycin B lyase